MINRGAIILRYKEPAVRWINQTDPYRGHQNITLEEANNDSTVYLISNRDAEDDHAVSQWVKKNFKVLFEAELEDWYNEPALWPKKLTYKLFQEWFDVESHSVLIDTVGGEIYDDGI